jgi:hypothetical protein
MHGSTPGTIGRANLDGSDMQLLVSNLRSLDGKVYWSDELQKSIKRANLDASILEQLYTSPGSLT